MIALGLKWALRVDARRDPPRGDEVPAGGERTSSQWTQIAKQNRSAEEPERAAWLCSTRHAFEHAIWHSDLRLKGASGVVRRGT